MSATLEVQTSQETSARRLALAGAYLATASMAVDFLTGTTGRFPPLVGISRQLVAPLVVAACAVSLVAAFTAPDAVRRRSGGAAMLIAGLIVVHGLTWKIAPPRPFDGSLIAWALAHGLLVALVLAGPLLREVDVYRLLVTGAVTSLATLPLGQAALSTDARSVAGLAGRLTGIYGHPNVTGLAAALLVVLAWRNAERHLGLVVALVLLALCASITAVAAGVAGIAALYGWRSPRVRPFVSATAFTALLGPIVLVHLVPATLNPTWFTGRVGIWRWSAEVQVDPWFGAGTDLFTRLRGSVFPITWVHAHDQMIMDLLTGGILLATATALLIVALWALVPSARAAALWATMVVTACSEVPFDLSYPGARIVLLGAVVAVLLAREPEPADG